MAGGYRGKILFVDLSKGELKDEVLDERLCHDFIGGVGFGAKVLFSRQKAGVDPLSPENTLGFVTGPLTGTPAPGGARYMVVAKSPLTGTWGDANSGGDFGPNLKFAGYDAIFLTGVSEKPVYLFIEDGAAETRDAEHLWGKETFETERILKSEHGEEARVACIGPAGEKLSLVSCVITNRGHAAGRKGLGAVMGSKKLKAVAVVGTEAVPLANRERVRELRREQLGKLSENPNTKLLKEIGTPGWLPVIIGGLTNIRNYGSLAVTDFPDPGDLTPEKYLSMRETREGCYRCPLACHGRMKPGKEYDYGTGAYQTEFESLSAFGSACLNTNLESIIMAVNICSRYGMDTISTGHTIAFAMECYEKGLITKKDTEGIELTWGNHKAIVAMTEKVAKREGFGAILADGVKRAAEKIGKGAEEYAMHLHGQELPALDPRAAPGMGLLYETDASGGDHCRAGTGYLEIGLSVPGKAFTLPEKGVYTGRASIGAWMNNYYYALDATGICQFISWATTPAENSSMLAAVTGWEYSEEELIKVGERIANTTHSFNVREGFKPGDFKLPRRIRDKIDMDTMVKEYFEVMEWDIVTGKPSKKKLLELGLEDVAKDLWP